MEFCFVYTRNPPALYTLNASAWLVLELCDGRSFRRLKSAFAAAVEPLMSPEDARNYLSATLRNMLKMGIIEKRVATARGRRPAPGKGDYAS
jgi:Coenzyme PQQ synthesis protein D (PqqD)